MAETTMPVTEAKGTYTDEVVKYEFAFHILPTVAEGEVPETLGKIKAHVTKVGGEIFDEEFPERLDLAYPIVKHMEGKNRRFTSAYFGWVRFTLTPSKLTELEEELRAEASILRHLIIRLTKVEEANPFRYHEHHKSVKMVEVIDEEGTPVVKEVIAEEGGEVSEVALDESLEKITQDEVKTEEKVA